MGFFHFNGRDARYPSHAAWGPAGGLSLAEGRGRLPEPGRMAGGVVQGMGGEAAR